MQTILILKILLTDRDIDIEILSELISTKKVVLVMKNMPHQSYISQL